MTPAAIRAAKGPALDAFVLERVCGFERHENEPALGGLCWHHDGDWWLPSDLPEVSTDNAACWRWVVPALVAKGYYFEVIHDWDAGVSERWECSISVLERCTIATAPTPALAIVRAAALTVAEGGE